MRFFLRLHVRSLESIVPFGEYSRVLKKQLTELIYTIIL
jgi:hypothetical protein